MDYWAEEGEGDVVYLLIVFGGGDFGDGAGQHGVQCGLNNSNL